MKKLFQASQKGFVALIAIALLFVFGFTGIMALYLVNSGVLSSENTVLSTQAFYLAESGLEQVRHKMVTYPTQFSCSGITGNSNFTNFTFSGAPGTFTVTSSTSASTGSSTLSSTISAVATTIPAVSTSSYDSSGTIMIDRELIDYDGISGNNFLNATRGAGGTRNVAHQSGTAIGQFQCTMVSQGGVPNLTTQTKAKRIVQATLQLSAAWAAGGRPAQLPIYRWNRPIEFSWNDYTIAKLKGDDYGAEALSFSDVWLVGGNAFIEHWNGSALSAVSAPAGMTQDLHSISCTASNYCWAVGANQTFLNWNGSTWTQQTVSGIPNVTYTSVDCVDSNDCWAVGQASSADVFVHWDGTSWTQNASSPSPVTNLNSVKCVATNDCWAVGASSALVHWDGTSWTTQTGPSISSNNYNAIDCNTTSDCWAVGSAADVYVHWNGSTWSRDAARPGATSLNSVSCSASNNCWAVGAGPITAHWDGSSWTLYSNPGPAAAYLNAVITIGPYFTPNAIWREVFP